MDTYTGENELTAITLHTPLLTGQHRQAQPQLSLNQLFYQLP